MKKILLTGATGFVGRALTQQLLEQNFHVTVLVRQYNASLPQLITQIEIGDLSTLPDNLPQLQAIDVVIHVAARAHIMHEMENNPLSLFRKINTAPTLKLAIEAKKWGVKRFIFISSIKVNGESSPLNSPFTSDINQPPDDPYALSKYEAEQGLLSLSHNSDMQVVIIRPPLVYGPGVKANFSALIRWTKKGTPLPLGTIHNQRSFIALDNLTHFILHCIDHPKASNEIFLISDGEDISTTQLLQKIAHAFHQPPRLIPIPMSWMIFMAQLIGQQAIAVRLFGSMQADISKAKNLLDWQAIVSMDAQLKKIVEESN